MTARRRLKAVPTSGVPPHKCAVVVQAVLAGPVDYRVQAMTPMVGPGHGTITMRLGRIVIVIEDREAYEAVKRAWQQVEEVVEQAMPTLPPPAYRPRPGTRA